MTARQKHAFTGIVIQDNENYLVTMDYTVRLDLKLLFRVITSGQSLEAKGRESLATSL